MVPKRAFEQTPQNERFWNHFGARFGVQNRLKIYYVFCSVFRHLKKLCSNDFELQKESKLDPKLIHFQNEATIRFCCYLENIRTTFHFRSCQIPKLIPMLARRDFFSASASFLSTLGSRCSTCFPYFFKLHRFLTTRLRKSRQNLSADGAARI